MNIIEFLTIWSLSAAVVVHLDDDARPKWNREVLNVPVVDSLVHSGDYGGGDVQAPPEEQQSWQVESVSLTPQHSATKPRRVM